MDSDLRCAEGFQQGQRPSHRLCDQSHGARGQYSSDPVELVQNGKHQLRRGPPALLPHTKSRLGRRESMVVRPDTLPLCHPRVTGRHPHQNQRQEYIPGMGDPSRVRYAKHLYHRCRCQRCPQHHAQPLDPYELQRSWRILRRRGHAASQPGMRRTGYRPDSDRSNLAVDETPVKGGLCPPLFQRE